MASDPFEPFSVPPEIRAFAENSVTQARQAFEGFVEAANKAVGQFQGHAQAARKAAPPRSHTSPSPMPSRTSRRRSILLRS